MRLQAAQLCPPWHAIGERLKQCPTETFEDEDREGDEAGEGGEAGDVVPVMSVRDINTMRIEPLRAAAARRGLDTTGTKKDVQHRMKEHEAARRVAAQGEGGGEGGVGGGEGGVGGGEGGVGGGGG